MMKLKAKFANLSQGKEMEYTVNGYSFPFRYYLILYLRENL